MPGMPWATGLVSGARMPAKRWATPQKRHAAGQQTYGRWDLLNGVEITAGVLCLEGGAWAKVGWDVLKAK